MIRALRKTKELRFSDPSQVPIKYNIVALVIRIGFWVHYTITMIRNPKIM